MAVYLKSLATTDAPSDPRQIAHDRGRRAARRTKPAASSTTSTASRCHGTNGQGVPPMYPPLANNQAINMEFSVNPIRMVLFGGFPAVDARQSAAVRHAAVRVHAERPGGRGSRDLHAAVVGQSRERGERRRSGEVPDGAGRLAGLRRAGVRTSRTGTLASRTIVSASLPMTTRSEAASAMGTEHDEVGLRSGASVRIGRRDAVAEALDESASTACPLSCACLCAPAENLASRSCAAHRSCPRRTRAQRSPTPTARCRSHARR